MLTVLPSAPPSVLVDRVGERRALERVRRGRPVDQAVVVEPGDLVAGRCGRDLSTPSLIETERATGIVYGRGPRAGDAAGAVESTSLRAAWTAACGLVSSSS